MTKKPTIKAQALAAGIEPSVVYQRVKKGWTLKKALTTPVRKRSPKKLVVNEAAVAAQMDEAARVINEATDMLKHRDAQIATGERRILTWQLIAVCIAVLAVAVSFV